MKVILTGSTGFIGGEVLNQAISHPSITSLICLTRRALPDVVTSNPKVKVIMIDDFATYLPEVLSQLEGAECCIWSMGAPPHKHPDLEACKKVEIGYTCAAAEAFASSLAPPLKEKGKVFRFVYLSGKFANRETDKKMWFLHNSRTNKGEAENGLLAVQENNSNFEVSIVRPGGVLAKGNAMPNLLINLSLSIKVDELAAVMIDEAVSDAKGVRTLENNALRNRARELLKE